MDPSSAHHHRRRTTTTSTTTWCCSFKGPPKSPDTHYPSRNKLHPGSGSGSGSGPISRRRILSPGRVSPIDSDPICPPTRPNMGTSGGLDTRPEVGPTRNVDPAPAHGNESDGASENESESESECECAVDDVVCGGNVGLFDVRLSLRGKNGGGFLVLEVNSKVLSENSPVFAALIGDCRKGGLRNGGKVCRIEVPDVENVGVFREVIELMFEQEITKKLVVIGAHRVIDILEVSTRIKFIRGVVSCLKYLEAVPWTEEEEEKLTKLFTKFKFEDAISKDILARLNLETTLETRQRLAYHLVWSITTCDNAKARNDVKSMVKGLLSTSSVHEKDHLGITKEDLYSVSQCCLTSLVMLFQDASGTISHEQPDKPNPNKPLIEKVAWQVDNINWLIEILLDLHLAEDFVDLWVNQIELLELHGSASPMVRYELSRVSATLFVAVGTRKLQCGPESRFGLLQSWFGPMLVDFGWLQRCRKGLDMRKLEEAMGQALLTLPLKQQYDLFMEWFRCFSKHGSECPNLSKAFQIWWRRSFLKGSETHAIESR